MLKFSYVFTSFLGFLGLLSVEKVIMDNLSLPRITEDGSLLPKYGGEGQVLIPYYRTPKRRDHEQRSDL